VNSTPNRFLYVPPGLILEQLRWVFCTDLRAESDFAVYIINWLVFITVV